MIAPEGTFDYVFDVNADLRSGAHITGRLRYADDVPAGSKRLFGRAPKLSAVEYQREAWQLYARFTLVASDPENATSAQESLTVERGLLRLLRQGDVLHLSRSGCGGFGLSILRDDSLIAAAGAITNVPLGRGAFARIPRDLIRQAERAFQTRDQQYDMHDYPVEVSLAGETRILHAGRQQMGPFDVFVRHGFLTGDPGTDVSASIERRGTCPDTAAHTTAELFERDANR